MSLPSEIVLDLPRITIIDDSQVHIENHKGLVIFTENELTVKSEQGYIQIKGSSFILSRMLPQEILLEGQISNIAYLDNHS